MWSSWLYGQNYKAGWGYNVKNASFISNVQINGLKTTQLDFLSLIVQLLI